MYFIESALDFLENCAKSESYSTSIAQKITEMHQKIMLVGEQMTEMNYYD